MPTLRVLTDYRVFGQDYLAGTTVVVPGREQAERLLAFRFQYAADMLRVFELVQEPDAAGPADVDSNQHEATGTTDLEYDAPVETVVLIVQAPRADARGKRPAGKGKGAVSKSEPAAEASASEANRVDMHGTEVPTSEASH